MGLIWSAHDPATGSTLAEFPGMQLKSTLTRYIGKASTSQLSLPLLDRLPRNWASATDPYRAVIACTYDSVQAPVLWAGLVEQRAWGSGPTVDLVVNPVENWLDRQYVQGSWSGDQSEIAYKIGFSKIEQNFHASSEVISTGVTRTRNIKRDDDITALSELQHMMRMTSGIEFTIDWRWSGGRLLCVPRVSSRIGRAAHGTPRFIISNATWTRNRNFSSQYGANTVTGTMTRKGDVRDDVTYTDQIALNDGYLPAEYRYQPDTTSTSKEVVGEYVLERLYNMHYGRSDLQLEVHLDRMVVGTNELQLGDDIVCDLRNTDFPSLNESTVQRLVGWGLDVDQTSGEATKLTPVFISPQDFDGGDLV